MSAAVLLLISAARAQDYRFPTSDADYGNFYPTAYFDHGGTTDWSCGSLTYSGHQGSDFGVGGFDGMYAGQDVLAAADGAVVTTNDGEYDECTTGDCSGGGGYGNYVKLEHDDGRFTYYAHLRSGTVAVSAGDRVSCGQKLGEVGSSGYSTGPHLHFEVREASGARVDPFDGTCSSPPSYWNSQGTYGYLPAPTCADSPPCAPEGTLTCGEAVSGRNDGGGATSEQYFYGCEEWTYSGPERAWTFATDLDEAVELTLSGLSADLDLYVLEDDACDGSGCLGGSSNSSGDEVVSFASTAGAEYTVVVDGWEGAVSDFTLSVRCEGGWPGEDSGAADSAPPVDSAPPDSGAADSASPDSGADGDAGDGWRPGGEAPPATESAHWDRQELAGMTGCSLPVGAAGGWGALLGLLALARRRA